VEQAVIVRYRSQLKNVNNSISKRRSWYQEAVDWGTAWIDYHNIIRRQPR
jgi:hypothetical protein